jgi:hypothetical protein
MRTVVWSLSGFHIVTELQNGFKFNIGYCKSEILQGIKDWPEKDGIGSARKSPVHPSNARPCRRKLSMDFLEAHGMGKVPNPTYSRELGPLDLKRQLSECLFDIFDDLLPVIHDILEDFDCPTLINVFEEWVKRFRQRIDIEREDVGYAQ